VVDPKFTNPRTDRVTLGVDRELWRETAVSLEYTYAKSDKLERLTDINLGLDGTTSSNGLPHYSGNAGRPNKAYGRVTTYISDASSKYWGLTGTFRRRFAQNLRANAVVTYSKDKDNDSNERNFSGIQAEDVNNLPLNWAYSGRDQRWKVATNATWDTPWWGIGLSGSFRYYTGNVINPVLGGDANGDTNNVDRPTIGCADPLRCKAGEGTHLARNSFQAPELHYLDLRAGKGFGLGGGKLSLFAECFNCTNAANFTLGGANSTWSTNNSNTPSATFGKALNVGDPRTWQLAMRFDF
jgi:hypothetical protein